MKVLALMVAFVAVGAGVAVVSRNASMVYIGAYCVGLLVTFARLVEWKDRSEDERDGSSSAGPDVGVRGGA